MHESLLSDIEKICSDTLPYYGCYLVGAVFLPARKDSGAILRIYVDSESSENGVNVSVLSEISRELGMILDVKDVIKFKYTLEVSSPGINRILFRFEDYKKYTGKKVKISLKNKIGGRINLAGEIAGTSENAGIEEVGVFDETEKKTVTVPFSEIKKGSLSVI